jgi:hypothetical protein
MLVTMLLVAGLLLWAAIYYMNNFTFAAGRVAHFAFIMPIRIGGLSKRP